MPLSRQLFNGRDWDPDARLYHIRARFYDPATGRFINPDPIRFKGGWNLYAYAGNDPLNFVDLFGLEQEASGWYFFCFWSGCSGYSFRTQGQCVQTCGLVRMIPETASTSQEVGGGAFGTSAGVTKP